MATPAQIAANRANCLKSCGPRTEEGKRIARANSLRHGMSGEGVVLPASDVAAVESRTESFLAEMRPKTRRGRFLVGQMAMLSVRIDRIGQHDMATSDYLARHAVERFDQAREDQAQALIDGIAASPRPTLKKLLRTPEGIDLLVEGWIDLKAGPTRTRRPSWTRSDLERAANLQGLKAEEAEDCDLGEVSERLWAETDPARLAEIRLDLLGVIDAQIACLEGHIETLDHDTIALDRDEAVLRAKFEGSKEAEMARRYESEASRRYTKCRKELEEVEARAAAEEKAARPAAAPPPPRPSTPPPPPRELASTCDEEPMEYDERLIERARQILGPDHTPLPTTMKPKPAPNSPEAPERRAS